MKNRTLKIYWSENSLVNIKSHLMPFSHQSVLNIIFFSIYTSSCIITFSLLYFLITIIERTKRKKKLILNVSKDENSFFLLSLIHRIFMYIIINIPRVFNRNGAAAKSKGKKAHRKKKLHTFYDIKKRKSPWTNIMRKNEKNFFLSSY